MGGIPATEYPEVLRRLAAGESQAGGYRRKK